CRYFLFFFYFPVNEVYNFRMVKVKTYHFGRTTCCTAAFDSACCTVTYFQEAHQPARGTATTQFFTLGTYMGEVSTYTRTIFKYTGFTYPQVHNTSFVHQIIIYA